MIRAYRILRKAFAKNPWDGEGTYQYGGRWSSPGTRLSYGSEHQSLSMLEYFVHIDKDDPPEDLVLAVAEIPASVSRATLDIRDLPSNWREAVAPPSLARFGEDLVRSGEHCLLLVPSVLAPGEKNLLISPAHADFKKLIMGRPESLNYDPRMFSPRKSLRH